jgi:ABC-2 type transport system ATP-binding protein
MTVEAQDLVKTYGTHFSLNIPSLHIGSGETFGLVGNNGAGKTTFLRLVLDLIQADEGRALIGGEDVAHTFGWKAFTTSYLDASFLLDHLTPDEFLVFVGLIYGMSRRDVDAALEPYRAFFTDRIFGERSRYIRDLSVGNAKKVGIVAALLPEPELLVLDEPFANLDPGSQIRLQGYVQTLNERRGTTLVISSHDLGELTEVCQSITVLDGGRVIRRITTSDETLRELKQYFTDQG